jgi:hypothetical protein
VTPRAERARRNSRRLNIAYNNGFPEERMTGEAA